MNIIKPSANAIAVTAANDVYGSVVVYVAATATAQVNVVANTGTQIGSFVIPANQYIFVQKNPTDTITANVAVQATPAAYRG